MGYSYIVDPEVNARLACNLYFTLFLVAFIQKQTILVKDQLLELFFALKGI